MRRRRKHLVFKSKLSGKVRSYQGSIVPSQSTGKDIAFLADSPIGKLLYIVDVKNSHVYLQHSNGSEARLPHQSLVGHVIEFSGY